MAKRQAGPVQRFIGSLIGVLVGFGMVGGAFFLLWTNEGRVDLSKITRNSVAVNGNTVDTAADGQLVAVTAPLTAAEQLGDPPYLRPGNYLQINRSAEMYAWEEDEDEDEDTGVTSYSYRKTWTSSPENSANFNNPNGHFNPPMSVQEYSASVDTVKAGAYSFNTQSVFLMHPNPLSLNREMTIDNRRIEENYIYLGEGSLSDPIIGDIRLSYDVYPANELGTVFGVQNGSTIETYLHDDEETIIFRAYQMDRATAIEDMRREFLTNLWLTRLGGTGLMWAGFMLILGPISALLGYVPILGQVGRWVIAIVTFMIAFVLSLITIIVSAILHNLIALIILLIIALATAVIFWQWRQRQIVTA